MHTRRPEEPHGHKCLSFLDLFVFAALFLFALASSPAMNYLVPMVPGRPQGIADRMRWYVHHRQWRADARTLVGVVRYLTE